MEDLGVAFAGGFRVGMLDELVQTCIQKFLSLSVKVALIASFFWLQYSHLPAWEAFYHLTCPNIATCQMP
jgi:hypothetical protein